MIRPDYLSLGDYVLYKNVICTVERLTSVHATIKPIEKFIGMEEGQLICADYEDLFFVPITENILKRAGFSTTDNKDFDNGKGISVTIGDKGKIAAFYSGIKMGALSTFCYYLSKLQHIAKLFHIEIKLE